MFPRIFPVTMIYDGQYVDPGGGCDSREPEALANPPSGDLTQGKVTLRVVLLYLMIRK